MSEEYKRKVLKDMSDVANKGASIDDFFPGKKPESISSYPALPVDRASVADDYNNAMKIQRSDEEHNAANTIKDLMDERESIGDSDPDRSKEIEDRLRNFPGINKYLGK
jgi:hypothetical protein